MAPATAVQDELAEEILLRIPPDDPALLVRAALVCKHSCRLIADPGFRRRFREFHGAPPMLGFFRNTKGRRYTCRDVMFLLGQAVAVLDEPSPSARFVSTSSLRLPRASWRRHWRVVDARHGRVLLLRKTPLGNNQFLVWDPVTNEKRDLGILPGSLLYRDNFSAAVFCADAGCTHHDCRHNPFTVVYVSITDQLKLSDCIYSSEAVQWHLRALPYADAQEEDYLDLGPSVLVGNLLYFVLQTNTRILEYNVATREMGVVDLPPGCSSEQRIMLMTAEDGCLGFAIVHKSKLCLWSREIGSDKDDAGWVQRRVIDLKMLLPLRCPSTSPHVVGFANGIGVIFVHRRDGLFTIDLKSNRVKKVCKVSDGSRVFPYMSYCTPALRATATSTGEGPTMGASSASEA